MNKLQGLLVDGTRYAPCYPPSMNSDHMPMTLCAIAGLGGEYDAMVEYREGYKGILEEIPRVEPISDWRVGIGKSALYPPLLAWFREQVAEHGIEHNVRQFLPDFVGSLTMEAFHPIIRLAYAIDFGSEAETAAALAYIVSRHRDVPVDAERVVHLERSMKDQVERGPRSFDTSGFTRNICELIDAGEYPVGCAVDVGECASIALDIYRSTRNFFALHMVTATQAVRICSELVESRVILAALTGGLLAAHRVVGSPGFDRADPAPMPDRLDREHSYKYAWACLSEYRQYRDQRYVQEILDLREKGLIPAWCANPEISKAR